MTANVRVRFLSFVLFALVAPSAGAQAPAPARVPARASRGVAIVSGTVYDSLAKRPLADAMVQLVASDSQARFGQTVTSDAKGMFQFTDVPDGRYMLGFLHPVLDSVGLEPIVKELVVANQQTMRVALSTPSPVRLRATICGPATPANSGGLLVGTVRRANDHKTASDVAVVAEWIEYSIGRGGVSRRTPRKVATTGSNGWFAICNVPSPGSMTLVATRGRDSTDVIEVDVTADGYARRELYLGTARTVTVGDTTRAAATRDSTLRAAPRQIHVGDGHISGRAIAQENGQPLAGAQVQVVGGPQTRANERGEWSLNDAPTGTRVIEVRAVGYYPTRQVVNVVDRAPPVHVELLTFKAVLSTVKVTASYDRYRRLEEFKERSKTGVGRFMTAEDIAARRLIVSSDLFRNMSGIYLDGTSVDAMVSMRSITSENCTPTFYLNGMRMEALAVGDIDAMVRPSEIAGIEWYMPGTAPLEFQPAMTGCGSILIWTK